VDQRRELSQRLAPSGQRDRFRGFWVDRPRDVVRVNERALKARLARQRGFTSPVGPSDERQP
jgi:hypothetical protein